jgi:pimeloyl-ACP methyl ester carboxylesterase
MLRNPFPNPEDGAKFVAGFQGEGGDARLGAFFDAMLTAAPAPLHEEIRAAAIAMPRAVVIGTLSASFPPEVWAAEKVSVPLYAVVPRTPQTDDAYVQFLHTLGNDVTVDILDKADHFLMLDDAGELNARLEKWLTAHKWIR